MRCFSCFSLLVLRPIESTVRKCIWCNIWIALYSCLVDLTDVALAFEYANSKLVDVVTVADVDDGGSCWQQFVADLEAEVWSYS